MTRVDVAGAAAGAAGLDRAAAARRVAVGGGTLAIGDGRRVLASRRGRLGGPGRDDRAGAAVDAVGADGARLAWVERGRGKGLRVGIVRLARLR